MEYIDKIVDFGLYCPKCKHEKDDEVKIEINPGEKKFVHLKANKPNWSVKSNVSYFIREAYT